MSRLAPVKNRMRILDPKIDFRDVLILPQRSHINSRADVNLKIDLVGPASGSKISNTIPIMASNMFTVGCFDMANALLEHRLMACLHKHYTQEQLISYFNTLNTEQAPLVFISTGASASDLEKLYNVLEECKCSGICLDVANGYTDVFFSAVEAIRHRYPHHMLMAGSICTPDILRELVDSGVDIARVGIGSGACCTTRLVAGVGYPQLSAILDCHAAAENILLCSDGGITEPGSAVKAFGAGANIVMIGSLFAGCEENCGEWIFDDLGNKVEMIHYGMASFEAQAKFNGGVLPYRTAEGKSVRVKYRGEVAGVIQELLGGIRSAATYVGCHSLDQIHNHVQFVKSTVQENTLFS